MVVQYRYLTWPVQCVKQSKVGWSSLRIPCVRPWVDDGSVRIGAWLQSGMNLFTNTYLFTRTNTE